MAFALVNNNTVDTAHDWVTSTASTTTVTQTTVGNLIVVVVQALGNNGVRSVSSITGGATYQGFHRETGTLAGFVEIWAGICTSAVTSITVNLNSTVDDVFGDRVTVLEFSGPLSPIEESGTSTGIYNATNVTDHDAAAVTPDTAETLFVGCVRLGGGGSSWTDDAEFTTANSTNSVYGSIVSYRIQSGSTTAQAYTVDSGGAEKSLVALVAFKGAGGSSNVAAAAAFLAMLAG